MYRVLVVDDDPNVLAYVQSALCDEDFEVDTTTNAEDAFELLSESMPAVML